MSTFLYFAYGSNLLAQRILMNNPSAVRIGIGKLNVCDVIGKLSKLVLMRTALSTGVSFGLQPIF